MVPINLTHPSRGTITLAINRPRGDIVYKPSIFVPCPPGRQFPPNLGTLYSTIFLISSSRQQCECIDFRSPFRRY